MTPRIFGVDKRLLSGCLQEKNLFFDLVPTHSQSVTGRGVSGLNVSQRGVGGRCKPPGEFRTEPRSQTHFRNNILKIWAENQVISHLLMAPEFGTRVIHMITLIFVLLVCWVYRHDIQATLQMEQFGTSIPPVLNSARSASISEGFNI